MSTIAPPPAPVNPALLDSEQFIDRQIGRTRRALKLVDLAAGLITLLVGLLAYILAAAVLDHWVFPGGLNFAGRAALFGVLLVGVAWYGWRQFVPLLRPINPVYAAQTIERGSPSLKNSLLNLLLFRTHRQHMSTRVYHALEQQAAQRLSTTTVDAAIDRSALLRLGYALVLIVAVCAVYSVLSPKGLAVSAGRVLAPWSDLAAPTRVQIVDIKPGKASVALGERLAVSAEVHGLADDETVRLRYSTDDEQVVGEAVDMEQPEESSRFEASLPRASESGTAIGVQKNLSYWIEAGDAHSQKFSVSVFQRPTIVVQRVRYEFPSYTGLPSKETSDSGAIHGLEGTRVTISALANQPIKSAHVDFDADGRTDLKMTADGNRATASFTLGLRQDRRTPQHASYMLRFTSTEGRTNSDPAKYVIDVTPDYAPEVRITAPEEPEVSAKVDDVVPIGVEAGDPDYAVREVRLVGKVKDAEVVLGELLRENHEGRFGAIMPFTPGDARLKPGDVLEYWAEAKDNRSPDANVAFSEHRRMRIVGGAEPPRGQQPPQQGGQGEPKQQGGGEQGEQQGASQGGAEGNQQGQQGEAGKKNESAEGADGQQGAGGTAGGQGEPSEGAENSEKQNGGGAGQAGEGQSDDPKQQDQPNGAGAGGNAKSSPDKPDGKSQGAQGAPNGSPPPEGAQQGKDQAQPGDASGKNGQSGDPAQQQGQQGAPQSKVAPEGDDGEAFQRIVEHMDKTNPGEGGEPTGEQQDAQAGGEKGQQADAKPQSGEGGAEQKSGDPSGDKSPQQGAKGQQGDGQKKAGQQSGEQSQAGQNQQQGGQPGDSKGSGENAKAGEQQGEQSGKGGAQKPAGAAGQSQQSSGQKPAAGAKPEGAQEDPGDGQQQGESGGQNPSERQGTATPRESKTGDGNPEQEQDGQEPSPDSAMNKNDGNAGSGHSTGQEQGSPGDENSSKKARDKQDEDNRQGNDDQEPPGGSPDNRESDSRGGKSGEQSGGGQEGAGQHADAKGKGEAGQNEAADEGSSRADEQGEGQTGEKAGSQQKAPGKTGQSSGDQKGEGSQQKPGGSEPGGEQPGEEQAGDQPQEGGTESDSGKSQGGSGAAGGKPSESQPEGREEQPPAGEEQEQTKARESNDSEGDSSSPASSSGAAGGQSKGGTSRRGEMAGPSTPPEARPDEADAATIDYARQKTDLVLERLDEQLAKKKVDGELLKNLGWNEAELRQFVERWKGLKASANDEGERGEEARQELDEALRSLGLKPNGPLKFRATGKKDELRDLNEGYRSRAPIEYADRVRAYVKGAAKSESTKAATPAPSK